MSRSERLAIIMGFCFLYLTVRFLTGVGREIERIAITVEGRVTQLEAKVLDLEVECLKRGEN